jgi:hypothetical protein
LFQRIWIRKEQPWIGRPCIDETICNETWQTGIERWKKWPMISSKEKNKISLQVVRFLENG